MGGGAMIRNVARLMGAATAGTAAIAPSSPAFCHVSSQEHLTNMPSALSLSQKEASPGGAFSEMQSLNADGFEYSSDEDWGKISYNRLIFTPAPSEEEVEEATRDLNTALHLSVPASGSAAEETSSVPEHEDRGFVSADVNQGAMADRQLPSFSAGLGLLAAGSSINSVYQAFHLFQTNTNVQDAVKSIARDPAVWKAVLSNEKVVELTRTLQGGQETASWKTPAILKEEIEDSPFRKFTTKVCDFVHAKVLQLLDKVVEIVGSVFSSVEKAFCSKEQNSGIDKTVASCMMLAVMVLLVVIIKRG